MRFFIAVTLLACFIQGTAQVKTFTPSMPEQAGFASDRLARIDKMFDELVSKNAIPGAVVLLVRDGKVALYKAYGYSHVEEKTALKKDDVFRIASQSKAVTALAAMMLWEEGKFLLDEPVSKYIPEFANPTILKTFNPADSSYTTEPAKSEVTIRQLFTHTSGIDYASIGSTEFKAIYAKAGVISGIGNNDAVLGDKIKILGKLPLKHQPGERWTYGLNSDVLGYLVEVWSGMSLDQFMKKRIFDPLGMKDTYFYLPKEKYNRLVGLYTYTKEGKMIPAEKNVYDKVDPNYPATAGKYFSGGAGLSSTVEDYAKFLQLFLNRGEFNGVRLLSRNTVELMLTDQKISNGGPVGLGFGLETPENDYKSVFSVGSFSWGGAFNTQYWADPKEKLIGLMFTNLYQNPHWNMGDRYKVLVYQSIKD